tara:strand:- start:601 stop:768 length:168 start_codon:yes stop_codon:yes gene_type:complete
MKKIPTSKPERTYAPISEDELRDKLYRKNNARHRAKLRRLQRIKKRKIKDGENKW